MGLHPVAIIGAGPVGLFAASECCARGLSVLLLDILSYVGGQCTALYKDKPLSGVPGLSGLSAQGLVDALCRQLLPYAPTIRLETSVTGIKRRHISSEQCDSDLSKDMTSNHFFTIDCVSNSVEGSSSQAVTQQIHAQRIIISTGGGRLTPNKLVAENVDEFTPAHVHYCVTNPSEFAGKRVVIAGGGNAAVDWALELIPIAKSVTLVHRRSSFRAHSEGPLKEQAARGRVVVLRNAQIQKLIGEGGVLKALQVSILGGAPVQVATSDTTNLNGEHAGNDISDATKQPSFSELPRVEVVEADELIVLFGLAAPTCNDWGVAVKDQKILVNPITCETSVPGIYAVGDAIWRESGIYTILPGFAEALTVAHTIKRELST